MTIKTYAWYDKEIYEQEGIDYDSMYPKMMQESKYKRAHIEQYIQEKKDKIPLFTHQICYYSTKMSGLPLKNSIKTTIKFNQVGKFKHFLWTNNPDAVPDELKTISGVEIHLISELKGLRLFPILKSLLEHPNPDKPIFTMASDITRIIVTREYGGVYHDLDYELYNPHLLLAFLQSFNFIAGVEHNRKYSFIGNAFFASTPNHPILHEASKLIERNLNQNTSVNKPNYLKYPETLWAKLIFETSPGMLSIAFYKGQNQENHNDILLSKHFLFNERYLWQNTPESRCHAEIDTNRESNSLINVYDGESIITIGADPFCGDWATTPGYLDKIQY